MDKLYPPKIDNILPAFTVDKDNNSKVKIIIPYWLNDSVGENDYDNIEYVIKSALTNNQVASGTIKKTGFNNEEKCYQLILTIDDVFTVGQYYKFQIAFVKNGQSGYFSNAGIARRIAIPTIKIVQSNLRELVGVFSDTTSHEKVYSYSFNLYDEFGTLMESSGEKIHNADNDTRADESRDVWEIQSSLQADINYKISYNVTTTGNYKIDSGKQTLSYFETIEPRIGHSYLVAENNFEEGYNRIYLKREFSETDPRICGNFILLRASHKDNYNHWEKLVDFQIYNWQYGENGKNSIFDIYKDYLIEQGTSYKYAIQAYHQHEYSYKSDGETKKKNVTIYSTKVINVNGAIYTDFEDMFLFDGERQLKIRFNSKIGGIKPVLLESKIDTIGGKYPFFFRNGNVNYKEFSLSGLISMISDQENNFTLNDIYYYPSPELIHIDTELSSYNYQKEREFKLKVLSWLTNGKEKVLKAPGEGNYIVRLMNSSLQPNDTLGRMLHSFTSTAYEVADYDFKNLKTFNFIGQPQTIKRISGSKTLSGTSAVDLLDSWYRGVKVDQAIIYTKPETSIKYTLMDGTSGTETSNVFGIIDLSPKLQISGLKSVQNTSGWDNPSKIEFSYLNFVSDTANWIYIYYAKEVKSKLDGNTWYKGQGIGVSMKDFLNKKDNTRKISSFPYIVISKRNNISDSSGGYYCIDTTGDLELDNLNSLTAVDEEALDQLKDTLTNTKQTIVYRNLNDFSLGQGLRAKVICPQKQFTYKSQESGDPFTYAV